MNLGNSFFCNYIIRNTDFYYFLSFCIIIITESNNV